MIDLDSRILEVNEVVAVHEIIVDGLERSLKVKILKLHGGNYMGVANLEVKGEKEGSHYRSLHIVNTKEDALKDAIRGFFAFYSEKADVREVENW